MHPENQIGYTDFPKICRICLTKDATLPIIGSKVGDNEIAFVLKHSISIKVAKDDLLPPNICKNCLNEAYRSYEFRQKSHTNIRFLIDLLKKRTESLMLFFDESEKEIEEAPSVVEVLEEDPLEVDSETAQMAPPEISVQRLKTTLGNELISNEYSEVTIKVEEISQDIDINGESSEVYIKELFKKECYQYTEQPDLKFEEDATMLQEINDIDEKPYECTECLKKFAQKRYLADHFQRQHRYSPLYECKNCHKNFKHFYYLQNHLKYKICAKITDDESTIASELTNADRKPHQCTECQKKFAQKRYLVDHFKRQHRHRAMYECKNCFKRFRLFHYLKRHLKYKLCEKTFATTSADVVDDCTNKKRLSESCRILQEFDDTPTDIENNTDVMPYQCTECQKTFARPRYLLDHSKRVHSNSSQNFKCFASQDTLPENSKTHKTLLTLECTTCGRKFKHMAVFQRHLKLQICKKKLEHSIKESKFTCKFCGLCFQKASNFKVHLEAHNLPSLEGDIEEMKKILPYTCNVCNVSFSGAVQYRRHMSRSHEKNKLLCNYCGTSCRDKFNLEQHIKIHTKEKEKSFTCDICTTSFITKNVLIMHIKEIHNVEKSFKCSICGKEFITKTRLKRHLASHPDEKRYNCKFCGKHYLLEKYLKVHLKSHTNTQV